MNYEKLPEWRLWLRSLLPSAASLAGSFVFVVMIVGFHLFLLAGDPNLIVPKLAGRTDDQLTEVYSMTVQNPLDKAFSSSSLGVASTAILWGLIGWAVYSAADYVLTTLREIRSDSRRVNVPDKDRVIPHPLHNQLVVRMLWRFTVGLVLIAVTASLRPFISSLFAHDVQLLTTDSVTEMLKVAGQIMLGWFVVLHLYVVLFRFFVLRTRVFGEIIY